MGELLDVRGLEVVYHTGQSRLKALHDVSFGIEPGEIVGIVGESGCGKSTIASALLRLLPPNGEIAGGRMLFKGRDLATLDAGQLRALRGHDLAMIFQDPMTSLNPAFTIETQMLDVQRAHRTQRAGREALRRRAVEMLDQMGIPDAQERVARYPHQFSGGLRQRIMIAMALMSEPGLLIADEPTSALDVTLEAQILDLIKELREARRTSVLFISHDLGVIAQLCDRVIVMYAGRVVEQGDVFSIFRQPAHPYTQALLASVPSRLHQGRRLATIPGRVPSLSTLPPGCKFADRCAYAQPICRQTEPEALVYEMIPSSNTSLPAEGPETEGLVDLPSVTLLFAGDGPGVRSPRLVRCHRCDPRSGYPAQRTSMAMDISEHTAAEAGLVQTVAGRDPVLLRLRGLSTHFFEAYNPIQQVLGRPRAAVQAVDGLDLDIMRGEVVGLVGESGCGKTTLGKTILGLVKPTSGQIVFDGEDISRLALGDMRALRRRMQMIFQDPYSSLSPRLPVSYLLTEPYNIHRTPAKERYTATQLLAMVGLSDEQARKYPHQISGGQARRVGIARALALRPEFLIADEPTSGLDVSVAASIINLMKDLAERLGLTYLIITHNLNVVGYIAHRTAVMYLGRLVEVGPTPALFSAPAHPYTLALLSAISEPDPALRSARRRLLLSGEIPSPKNPPPGCRFHPRCPFAEPRCRIEAPGLQEVAPGRQAACHFWQRTLEQNAVKEHN